MRLWPARAPRGSAADPDASGDAELFDEAFQKRLEYLALVSRRVFSGRTRAEQRSRKAGAGVEFADFRRYYPGDDYRQIDWNVYGRIDRLVLRLYEQEEDLSVYLLLDCSASMGFGSPSKLRYGKQLTAALAYVAHNHLDRVSVSARTDGVEARMPPTRGRNRIFTLFDFLRPLRPSGPTRLADAVGTFVAQNKRRGVAVLISDLYDPAGCEGALDRLRYARFEPHVIQLVDPREAEPSARGDVELIDAETGERRATTITPRLLERYRQAYATHQERIASACVHKQVGLSTVDVRTPPADAMLHLLRRGGLVS
jgi:uncharacterized protein (DUF58 family)